MKTVVVAGPIIQSQSENLTRRIASHSTEPETETNTKASTCILNSGEDGSADVDNIRDDRCWGSQ